MRLVRVREVIVVSTKKESVGQQCVCSSACVLVSVHTDRRDIKRPLQSLETTLFFSLHLFLDFVLLPLLPFVSICIPFVS